MRDRDGAQEPARERPAAVVQASTPGELTVKAGESLYLLSRRHNIPMRALIEANQLQPPYLLNSGQRIVLPAVRTYEVQAGDTLSGIARRFGFGTSEMVRANAIAPPYHVRTGQVLILPGDRPLPLEDAPVIVAGRTPAPAMAPAPVETAPLAPIASSVDADQATARTEPPAYAAKVEVAARGPAVPVVAAPPVPAPVIGAPAPSQSAPEPVSTVASVPAAPETPRVEPVAVTPRAPLPDADDDPPARSGRGFVWPVRGTIVSDYGAKPGGLQNDGINIAAPRGTPIRAAEGGTVVYAGNELRGFGNLLLVRHRDGWITAYAHADELLVKRGAEVRRGQVIARVGSSGGVSSPQLHFEVRKGTRHVNPRDVLSPQVAQLQLAR